MAIPRELKEILVCPRCKGDLAFRDAENEIVCGVCKLVFPVIDDVPVMVVEEAKPLSR
jgi:uncharacterized protein YbaR (Trm112 family)